MCDFCVKKIKERNNDESNENIFNEALHTRRRLVRCRRQDYRRLSSLSTSSDFHTNKVIFDIQFKLIALLLSLVSDHIFFVNGVIKSNTARAKCFFKVRMCLSNVLVLALIVTGYYWSDSKYLQPSLAHCNVTSEC